MFSDEVMETEGKRQRALRGLDGDLLLQWGSRKRLRCMKVREAGGVGGNRKRAATRINRRVIKAEKDSSSPNRLLKEWESLGSESKKSSQPSSPEKEESRLYLTRGSAAAVVCAGLDEQRNGAAVGVGDQKGTTVLPRFYISLSSKEKEEDFMMMKGCKLPQRPKKRSKLVQRTILLVSPGAWLSDLCQERYEVRERKNSRKRKRGLKAMSMESDSE